mmetsp:Transcript_110404/g.276382  ORF Transcript_110404/g.276382 Transcript_110404/m.276382 type:complete len:228 (-) Transcript_110404:19-702(-)
MAAGSGGGASSSSGSSRCSIANASGSGATALDSAQALVQSTLQVVTELHDGLLGAPSASSSSGVGSAASEPHSPQQQKQQLLDQAAAERALRRYADLLRSMDQKAPGLSRFRIPLSAVRHLDDTGLGLGMWLQGLVRDLRAANDDARSCAEQFAELADRLRADGTWGADTSAAIDHGSPASGSRGGAHRKVDASSATGPGATVAATSEADRLLMPPPPSTPAKRSRR